MKKIILTLVMLSSTLLSNCIYNHYNAYGSVDTEIMLLLTNKVSKSSNCGDQVINVKYIESFRMNKDQSMVVLTMVSGNTIIVEDALDFVSLNNLILKGKY